MRNTRDEKLRVIPTKAHGAAGHVPVATLLDVPLRRQRVRREVLMTGGEEVGYQQILNGSFSAVSKPISASKILSK